MSRVCISELQSGLLKLLSLIRCGSLWFPALSATLWTTIPNNGGSMIPNLARRSWRSKPSSFPAGNQTVGFMRFRLQGQELVTSFKKLTSNSWGNLAEPGRMPFWENLSVRVSIVSGVWKSWWPCICLQMITVESVDPIWSSSSSLF